MFLYDFTVIDAPVEQVARALDEDAAGLLQRAAAGAGGDGPSAPQFGARRARAEGSVLPVVWEGTGWPGAFVHLEGEIEAAAIDAGHTHLSVSASVGRPSAVTESRGEAQRRRLETERVLRAFVTALGAGILAALTT